MDRGKHSIAAEGGVSGATTLEGDLDSMVAILETHLANHQRLISVLRKKRDACVEARIEELDGIVDEEKASIDAIGASERERIQTTDRLAVALDRAAGPASGAASGSPARRRPRLVEILNRVDGVHRDLLLDLRDELREAADELSKLNQLNRTLVLQSLENVHLYLLMLRGDSPGAATYARPDRRSSGESAGGEPGSILLDRRI